MPLVTLLANFAFGQNNRKMEEIVFKPFWSKKEVNMLLQKYAPKKRIDLDDADLGLDYYEFSDGKILVVLGSSGTMYRSVNELKKIVNTPPIRKNDEHFLSNLIPDGELFLKSIDLYIDTLADKLKINREKLDKSLESIKLIDIAYNKNKPEEPEFFNTDYLYLVAYLGEVYKKEKNGEWIFKKEANEESYQPYVKTNDGKILNPFYDLFKECFENYKKFSIFQIADFALSEFRLKVDE